MSDLGKRLAARQDRRESDITPVVERRLSPMARRVLANKADGLRTGGERPMGYDSPLTERGAA